MSRQMSVLKMQALVTDVMTTLRMMGVRETVTEVSPGRWLVRFEGDDAILEAEILEEQQVGCVLTRYNVGRRAMARIMDALMDALEARSAPVSGQPPGQGEPPALAS